MGFTLTLQCPIHPTYAAKFAPPTRCKACALMFTARNEVNKALSVPVEERTDLNEIIIMGVA
jgi:hypothetical protein